MCFIQVGFAAALKNSIVYEIMQHFINFVSIVCVAFATGIPTPYSVAVCFRLTALRSVVPELVAARCCQGVGRCRRVAGRPRRDRADSLSPHAVDGRVGNARDIHEFASHGEPSVEGGEDAAAVAG
jgi:hypothetical protein